jgi:hypothetical protein
MKLIYMKQRKYYLINLRLQKDFATVHLTACTHNKADTKMTKLHVDISFPSTALIRGQYTACVVVDIHFRIPRS